jgi:hypothetical protein
MVLLSLDGPLPALVPATVRSQWKHALPVIDSRLPPSTHKLVSGYGPLLFASHFICRSYPRAVASDGKFLYLYNNDYGLLRIGSGLQGTLPGHV